MIYNWGLFLTLIFAILLISSSPCLSNPSSETCHFVVILWFRPHHLSSGSVLKWRTTDMPNLVPILSMEFNLWVPPTLYWPRALFPEGLSNFEAFCQSFSSPHFIFPARITPPATLHVLMEVPHPCSSCLHTLTHAISHVIVSSSLLHTHLGP